MSDVAVFTNGTVPLRLQPSTEGEGGGRPDGCTS